uniref:GH18 domain-containing protein n=1 Tax=Acrobeloides nanus TaxID=290746 RepID=A0A914EGW8_9BILA
MMKPIFYLVLIFAYFSWHVLGDDQNEKDSGEEENGGAFYCFLVRNTCDKIDLYSELDPYKNLSCTHMVYGFAIVDSTNWTVSPSWWDTQEVEEWEGNNTAVTSLHESSNMSILLGIYNDGNLSFIDSPESRENFAKEVVKSARQHGFQGIFFYFKSSQHFEDPQFLDFLVSLKKELDIDAEDSNRLQVVISIEPKHFERSHEVFPNIVPYFDGFYLLSDDTPSSERNDIAFQVNPLFPSTLNQTIVPEETISVIAEDLVDNLIPRDKLIIGLSVWANSFVLEDPNLAGHGEKVITKVKDSVTGRNDGKLAYFEICGLKNSSDIVYDSTAETTSFSAEGLWFSLNVPGHESFEKKLKWIEENKFGGVGLTSLKADDKDGVCGEGPFPVHRYVGEQLQRSQSISESEDNNNKAPACTRICIIRPEDTPSGFSFSNIETRWCSHIVLSSAKILV